MKVVLKDTDGAELIAFADENEILITVGEENGFGQIALTQEQTKLLINNLTLILKLI